ncbi:putative fusion protein [Serratia phage vB_SmaP-Kaonashi]|nr:putative fusion protein [Serratia phage vB_SmaP-Kaonashi]
MAKTFTVKQTADITVTLSTEQVAAYEKHIRDAVATGKASPFAKHLFSLLEKQGVEAAIKSSIGNLVRNAVKMGLTDAQSAMSATGICQLTFAPPRSTTMAKIKVGEYAANNGSESRSPIL